MPLTACPSCGPSADIEVDDFNGHSQVVCTNCGHVIEQGSYYGDDNPNEGANNYCPPSGPISVGHGSKLKAHLRANDVDRNAQELSRNGLSWLKHTEMICCVQGLSKNMTKEVVGLFEQAYKRPRFLYRNNHKKRALSGACFYTICRQYSWPILLKYAASAVQSSVEEVSFMFKALTKEFGIEIFPLLDVESHVPSVLNEYSISDKVIQDKAMQICALARETWLACGRKLEPLILAAAFLAWKSLGNGKTFNAFERMTKSKLPKAAAKRIKELKEVLLRLAREIPWITQTKLTKETVCYYLDDVLKNKRSLMLKVKPPEDFAEDSATLCNGTVDSSFFLPPSHKKRKLNDSNYENKRGGDHEEVVSHDLTSLELSEQDIPDSEIHQYIRSPEEAAEREEYLKTFEDNNGDNADEGTNDEMVKTSPKRKSYIRNGSMRESETSPQALEESTESEKVETLENRELDGWSAEDSTGESPVTMATPAVMSSASEMPAQSSGEIIECERILRRLENGRPRQVKKYIQKKSAVKLPCVSARKMSLRPRTPKKH